MVKQVYTYTVDANYTQLLIAVKPDTQSEAVLNQG